MKSVLIMPFASVRKTEPHGSAEPSPVLLARGRGAYLGLAVGDALGATVEFMTPREIQVRYGVHRRMIGGGWLRLQRGQVTDDTGMSLALGRAVLARGGFDALAIAEAFSDWMRSKPVDIGNTVRRGVMHFRNTGATAVATSEYDAGNGACMRALPVALATYGASLDEVRAASRLQAHITHHNAVADAGCECVIQMVQTALKGCAMSELKVLAQALVAAQPLYCYEGRRQENPSGYIVDTLQAVFQALFSTDSFEAAMLDVVNRGGDADTTGAILGMIAGAHYGLESIPKLWLKALDKQTAAECLAQAEGLLRLAHHAHP